MTELVNLLYGIPIVGLIFQFIGYLIVVIPDIAPIMMRTATPIAFAALCGVICERSGVVNIGIEGTMLAAAFVGWFTGVILGPSMGGDPTALFGFTPALLIGLGAAMVTGMLVSLLHAWLSISVRADQIISGTIINIAAFGVTGYLNSLLSRSSPVGAGSFTLYRPPADLTNLPAVGWIFRMLLNQGPITISLIVIVIVLQFLLFRSRWGLRTRAVGEHPKAAETVGVNVVRLRYRNVVLAGALAALGGAVLSMETTSSFHDQMTAGRGFIGLAAMIVGRWTPLGAFGTALLFSSAQAVSQSLTFVPPPGQLGDLLASVPPQFYDALPYLVTVIVLTGLIGRSVPPAADGKPYQRESPA